MIDQTSVGLVKRQYFTFAEPPHEMPLESGEKLGPITLAYETCGRLNLVRKRWDKFRVPAAERKATGVPALEYMIGQQEKRGRGRPRKI
jgi:hypothetical protein